MNDLNPSVACDGKFIYINKQNGRLIKVGTGLKGTCRGQIYSFKECEPGWLAYTCGQLFFRPVSLDRKSQDVEETDEPEEEVAKTKSDKREDQSESNEQKVEDKSAEVNDQTGSDSVEKKKETKIESEKEEDSSKNELIPKSEDDASKDDPPSPAVNIVEKTEEISSIDDNNNDNDADNDANNNDDSSSSTDTEAKCILKALESAETISTTHYEPVILCYVLDQLTLKPICTVYNPVVDAYHEIETTTNLVGDGLKLYRLFHMPASVKSKDIDQYDVYVEVYSIEVCNGRLILELCHYKYSRILLRRICSGNLK